MKQKSKVEWLRAGDCNSGYFHKVVKGNTNRNRIHSVEGLHGGLVEGRHVATRIVQHYEQFLGGVGNVVEITNNETLFTRKISHENAMFMFSK